MKAVVEAEGQMTVTELKLISLALDLMVIDFSEACENDSWVKKKFNLLNMGGEIDEVRRKVKLMIQEAEQ